MPLVESKQPSAWGGDTRAPVESGNYLSGFQYDYGQIYEDAAVKNLYNAPKYLYNYGLGALGKTLFWIDRPYTAIMSGIDAAITNGDVFKEAWRGVSGQRQASMETIIEDLGADPDSGWTTAAGIGLDFFPGMFLDPVNYLSFGTKGVIGGALKGTAKVAGVLDQAKFTPEFIEAVESLGKLGKKSRAELARKGLYGLNVRLPYAPVIGKHIQDSLSGQGDFGKKLTREGFIATPRFVNEAWGRGVDGITENPYFMTVSDKLQRTFGGMKYALDKAGLTHLQEFTDILRSKQSKERYNAMVQESELAAQMTEEEKLYKIIYGVEAPWSVNATAPVPVGKIAQRTPEERARIIAESNKLASANNDVAEIFNRGMIAEIEGIRGTVDNWLSSRKRVVAVNLGDLFDNQAPIDEMSAAAAKGATQGGPIGDFDAYVEDILVNPGRLGTDFTSYMDAGNAPAFGDEIANQWRAIREVDNELAALGQTPLARVRFLAFAPSAEIEEAASKIVTSGASGVNAPKWSNKAARKEGGWFWKWKRGEMTDEEAVWASFGMEPAAEYPTGFESRLKDLQGRRKRQANIEKRGVVQRKRTEPEIQRELDSLGRKYEGQHVEQEMEFAGDLLGDRSKVEHARGLSRDTALFEIDAFDTITPEFQAQHGAGGHGQIGGNNPLEVRKQRIYDVLDKLQGYIEQGGVVGAERERKMFGKTRTTRTVDNVGDAYSLIEKFWRSERSNAGKIANESLGKQYRSEWIKAAKAAGLDPDDHTTQMLLESIYLRRVAYTALPGHYAATAMAHSNFQAARALFGGGTRGEVLDPVALWWTNTEELRRQLDVVEKQIEQVRSGAVPIETKLEALSDEEIETIRNSASVTEQIKTNYLEVEDQIANLKKQRESWMERMGDDADEEIDRLTEEISALDNKRFAMMLTAMDENPITSPARELESRYMLKLLKKRDDIGGLLKQTQDPFLTAKNIADELAKTREIAPEILRKFGYDLSVEEIEGMKFSQPELERLEAASSMMAETWRVIEDAHKQYDPNFRMPIQNYVLHQMAVNSQGAKQRIGAFQAFVEGRGITNKAKAVRDFRTMRTNELKKAGLTMDQIKARVESEVAEGYGIKPVHLTKKEMKEGPDFLKERQYGHRTDNPYGSGQIDLNTLQALRRSNFGGDWETQFSVLYNQMFHNMQKWDFTRKLVEEMKKSGIATDIRAMDRDQIAAKLGNGWQRLDAEWVYGLLENTGKENPFAGLAVNKEVYDWYAKTMTGMSPILLESPGLQKFVNTLEGFRRWFSAWTLLPFPSYLVRNVVGDTLRATMEGLDLEDTNSLKFAWSVVKPTKDESNFPMWQRERQRVLSEGQLDPFVQGLPESPPDRIDEKINLWKSMVPEGDAMRDSLNREGLLHYLYANVIEHNIRDIDEVGESGVAKTTLSEPKNRLEAVMQKLGKASNWMPLIGTDSNRILQFAGKWNTALSNANRLNLWTQTVERALSDGVTDMRGAFDMGNDAVRRALFNYSDLTDVERHVFKNINFFYTYLARSLPFHIEKLVTRPDLIAPYARSYNALWGSVEDEGFKPEDMRDFLQEQMGLPLYEAQDDEGNQSYVVWSPSNWIGIADVNEAAEWIRSFSTVMPGGAEVDSAGILQALGMNINPVLKGIIETATQKDMMTGQDLSNRDWVDFLGMPMPQPAARILRNIRLFSEIDRLNPGGVWTELAKSSGYIVDERAHRHEAPERERWAQFFTGMRLFESTPVKDIERNILDTSQELSELKSRVRRSARSGNLLELRQTAEIMQQQVVPELEQLNNRLRFWQAKKSEAAHAKAAQIGNRVP